MGRGKAEPERKPGKGRKIKRNRGKAADPVAKRKAQYEREKKSPSRVGRKEKLKGYVRPSRPRKIDPLTGEPMKSPATLAAEAKGEAPPKPTFRPGGGFAPGNPTAWKPGQSGNPYGRRGANTLPAAYRQVLAAEAPTSVMSQIDPDDPEGRTFAEAVARKMINLACNGVVPAAAEIRQATEGTRVRHSDEDWRQEIESLGLDADEAMAAIQALLADMAEAKAREIETQERERRTVAITTDDAERIATDELATVRRIAVDGSESGAGGTGYAGGE